MFKKTVFGVAAVTAVTVPVVAGAAAITAACAPTSKALTPDKI